MATVIRYAKSNYFRLPGISWILLILLAVYIMSNTAFSAEFFVSRYRYFGPLGHLGKYLRTHNLSTQGCISILLIALVCHVYESYIVWQLCRKKEIGISARIKWVVATMCFGGCSVYELARYQPKESENHTN